MGVQFTVMGIVNATPDSFSDGGEHASADAAAAHGRRMLAEGAALIDIGGESTRPGAQPVGLDEERRRVLPVVEALAAEAEISVDTSKAALAGDALAAGAHMINDVTALRGDAAMAEVLAQTGARCCLMHMEGEPRTMQSEPSYGDVVDDVRAFLEERVAYAVGAGIAEERIVLDPGIGFGKTVQHNLELLERLGELTQIGRPLLVGTSRKSFLGRLAARDGEDAPVRGRLPGTIATNVLALERGASIFRVHDVGPVRDALAVAAATLGAR